MTRILEVIKSKIGILVFCTSFEAETDEIESVIESVSVFDVDGDVAKISKIHLETTRECFLGRPAHPWFKLEEEVDEKFLKEGNRVVFHTKKKSEAQLPETERRVKNRPRPVGAMA